MEEKIDLKKFDFKKNESRYEIKLSMPYERKYLFLSYFSFFVSVLLVLEVFYNIFYGNIGILMIIFDLFVAVFFLIANILASVILFTKEAIKIDSKELVIEKKFFFYSSKKSYKLSNVTNIKSNPKVYGNKKKDRLKMIIDFITLKNGVIQFNDNDTEERFGLCLEAVEGKYLIENYFSNYLIVNSVE